MITRVFVNGTFDILHIGHLALLNYAKSLGDELTVAIDSDQRIRRLKGPGRPIHSEDERTILLLNLKAVDWVVRFDSDEELRNYVKQCDIMVKGSDYRGKPIVGEDVCKRINFFERIDGYSSTKIIQNITAR